MIVINIKDIENLTISTIEHNKRPTPHETTINKIIMGLISRHLIYYGPNHGPSTHLLSDIMG